MDNQQNKSRKISQLNAIQTISTLADKKNVWVPAAKYDIVGNSYSNVAISLEAITSYVNSYLFSYISNIVENSNETTYVSYTINNNIDNEDIIAYVSGYTSNIIKSEIEKISNNVVELYSNLKNNESQHNVDTSSNKKISELDGRETITKHQDHTWFPVAQYDSRTNTYHNIALNLKTITDYTNSYSYQGILELESRLNQKENEIDRILNSYIAYIAYMQNDIPISYITAYCSSYSSYLIQTAVSNLTENLTTLIEGIKNDHSHSYFRNNSKKISELKGRENITTYQNHSWLPVAQYDQRTNSYHNIAINLGTITSYSNSYASDLISYVAAQIKEDITYISYNTSDNVVTYVAQSFEWQNIDEGYEPVISLEDLQELTINKKFITLNSEDYTEEAFDHIKNLVFDEKSILFDQSTHLIWALGKWFGGDVLKKDLYYYSKIQTIDLDDEIIDSLDALTQNQAISFKSHNGITIDLTRNNDKDILAFGLNVREIISNKNITSKYILYIDDDGKIDIKEHNNPIINIFRKDYDGSSDIELEYELISDIPLENWKEFEIIVNNCRLIEHDVENHIIKINTDPLNYIDNIEETIKIKYDDGYSKNEYILKGIYNIYCYYGYLKEENNQYVNLGFINIYDNEDTFIIDQGDEYYGFFRCPQNYNPIFIDNIRYMQGAWHKQYDIMLNEKIYKTYVTENSGLGKIEWKVKNNI